MDVDRIAIDFLGEYKSVMYISGFKALNCIGSEFVKFVIVLLQNSSYIEEICQS